MNEISAAATATSAHVHPLDAMLQLQPQGDGSFIGRTHASYANMVGPYGGATAALLLHSVLQHPQCLGAPLSLTVNFAGPVQDGAMHIVVRVVRTNRTTQHWLVELRQSDATTGQEHTVTTASVVTALRRPVFEEQLAAAPQVPAAQDCPEFDVSRAMTWLQRYEWRVISGGLPAAWDDSRHPAQTRLWVRDRPARALDFASLTALCDVFFPRVWLVRARPVPIGTVSLTVYFHADAAQLAAHGSAHVLGQADGQVLRGGFFDQSAQLWDAQGQLLATSHQIVYYKE